MSRTRVEKEQQIGQKKNAWAVVSTILLYIYLFCLVYFQYMLQVAFKFHVIPLLLCVAVAAGLTWGVRKGMPLLFHKMQNIRWKTPKFGITIAWFVITFIISYLVMRIFVLAYYPGFYSLDATEQYMQSVCNLYTDYHPFAHTYLFFTIPRLLSGATVFLQVLKEAVKFQILCFSLAFAYLTSTIRKNGCPAWLCAVQAIFVMAIPITQNCLLYVWKDDGMAIFLMIAIAQYINIVFSKGAWLKNPINVFMIALNLALATLMRHNAILFTAPLVLGILIFYIKNYRKQVLAVAILCVGLVGCVKGPIQSAFHVEKPGNRVVETTGICMVMMGNALVNCPEQMDAEIVDFLYTVAPKETWEAGYTLGDFNNVKFAGATNMDIVETAGLSKILNYTWQTIQTCPSESLQALAATTGIIWKVGGEVSWTIPHWGDGSDLRYGKIEALYQKLNPLCDKYQNFMDTSIFRYLYVYIGWFSVLLVILGLGNIRKGQDVQYFFHILPVICYNFGTAIFLTTYDWRYFYYVYPIAIPIIFLLVKQQSE